MTPYSQDLRQRIVKTARHGGATVKQIAARFLVSVSFVTRLLQLHRATGSVEPRPHGGGNPAVLTPEDLERLRELIRDRPDATLEECRRHLGSSCSLATICRALSRLGLPRKKKIPRAAEQDSPEVQEQRREFCEELADVDPQRLVFVDECGANTAMTRTHGRAPAGQRVYSDAPGRWDSITLTCGMRLGGAMAAEVFPGATDTVSVRGLRRGGAGPGIEARRRGDLGQRQAAQVGRSDRGRRGGRGTGGAPAAVQPGPDADRGDVLEGQGRGAIGRGADDRSGVCGVRVGLA